jgi:hypothetical protein
MSETKIGILCWCERVEVLVPVEWVREGRTESCGSERCSSGCVPYDGDDDDEPGEDPYDEAEPTTPTRRMNRFMTTDYNPAADSTPGHTAIRANHPYDLILQVGVGLCPCGCAEAPSSKRAVFRMGHDIRLRGKLMRAHAARVRVALVDSDGVLTAVVDPVVHAEAFSTPKLDWPASVIESAERITRRTASRGRAERIVIERATRGDRDGAELLQIGRWREADGAVAAIYRIEGGLLYEWARPDGTVQSARKVGDGEIEMLGEVAS